MVSVFFFGLFFITLLSNSLISSLTLGPPVIILSLLKVESDRVEVDDLLDETSGRVLLKSLFPGVGGGVLPGVGGDEFPGDGGFPRGGGDGFPRGRGGGFPRGEGGGFPRGRGGGFLGGGGGRVLGGGNFGGGVDDGAILEVDGDGTDSFVALVTVCEEPTVAGD